MRIDKPSSERITLLRFLLIVGVVYIHARGTEFGLANGVVGLSNSSYLSDFLRSLISDGLARISIPLFFLFAGYFFFLCFSWSIDNYKKKIKSRIKSLLIPFLFWNLLTLFLYAVAQNIPATQIYFSGKIAPLISTFGAYDYLNAIIGIDGFPISYQFWFIRDLMLIVLLVPLINVAIKGIPKVFLAGILVCWFFNIWPVNLPAGFTFFSVGAYFARSNISLFKFDRFGIPILSAYSVILLMDTLTKGWQFNNYIHHLGLLLGVPSMLFLSKFILGMDRIKKALLWAGSCSFFVFATHEPLLRVVRKVVYKALTPDSDMMVLALYFSVPVFVITASLVLHTIMRSLCPRFLSLISGGR
jgi:fucose 4-O-acetylase-like acetyltransferase